MSRHVDFKVGTHVNCASHTKTKVTDSSVMPSERMDTRSHYTSGTSLHPRSTPSKGCHLYTQVKGIYLIRVTMNIIYAELTKYTCPLNFAEILSSTARRSSYMELQERTVEGYLIVSYNNRYITRHIRRRSEEPFVLKS